MPQGEKHSGWYGGQLTEQTPPPEMKRQPAVRKTVAQRLAEARVILAESAEQGITITAWARQNGKPVSSARESVKLAKAEDLGLNPLGCPDLTSALNKYNQWLAEKKAKEAAIRHERGMITGASTGENLRPNPYEPPR